MWAVAVTDFLQMIIIVIGMLYIGWQVSDMVGAGLQVKQIAEKLGISPRTVEVYKSRMSQKLRGRDGLPASSSDD